MLLSLVSNNYMTIIFLLPPGWDASQSQFCHKPGIHLDGLEPWPFNPESSKLNQKTRLTCQKSATWERQSPGMRANGKQTLGKSRDKQKFTWIQFNIWFIYRLEGEKGKKNGRLPVLIFSFNWKKNLGLISVGTICAFLI